VTITRGDLTSPGPLQKGVYSLTRRGGPLWEQCLGGRVVQGRATNPDRGHSTAIRGRLPIPSRCRPSSGCVKPALRREAARRADDGGIEIPNHDRRRGWRPFPIRSGVRGVSAGLVGLRWRVRKINGDKTLHGHRDLRKPTLDLSDVVRQRCKFGTC
jgi:hypothetical protein